MISIFKGSEIQTFLKKYENRTADVSDDVRTTVSSIIKDIRTDGDTALAKYTLKFDNFDIQKFGVAITQQEIEKSREKVPDSFIDLIHTAAENIRRFHKKAKPESWLSWEENNVVLGQKVTSLDRVGLYVPGGRAVYPSSLLMTAIPAQVAGVKRIAIVSPANEKGQVHPSILAAANILGINEIYRVGGAQAIAALAFGTDKIPGVDKIVGPGNIYVAEAKRQVYGIVDIDMIAGPSEVVILADTSADPAFVASDLLAQAEHDPEASSICVTDDASLSEAIKAEVESQTAQLDRKSIIRTSLENWGAILITGDMTSAIQIVNYLAPEHLGIHTKDPWAALSQIQHAGAIFLGHYSPESVGDYWAGPNHVLPTNRTARFASPLGTEDFLKKSSIISYSREALKLNGKSITTFAEMEGLDGHANAVRQRTNE